MEKDETKEGKKTEDEGKKEAQDEITLKLVKEDDTTKEIDVDKENLKKDPIDEQDNLDKDHPKYREIWGKLKESEKKIEVLKKAGTTTKEVMEGMKEHNQDLASAMKKMADSNEIIANAAEEKNEKESKDSEIKGLEKKQDDLISALAGAKENGNYQRESEVTSLLMDIKDDIKAAKTKEDTNKSDKKGNKGGDIEEANKAQFRKDNPWFGTNLLMTASAGVVENKLLADPEWTNKSNAEFYGEVKRLVEEGHNYKIENQENGNEDKGKGGSNMSGVEGAGGSGRGGGMEKITLSAKELAIAAGFNQTPEEFATEKARIALSKAQ